jgi:hypothetical protein
MKKEVENPMVLPFTETPLKVVAFCVNCDIRLFADEEFLQYEDEYLCETDCLMEYMDVKKVEGIDINGN